MEVRAEVSNSTLSEYTRVSAWVAEKRGGTVFQTEGAVYWFIRQHRQRLVADGVLIPRRGPGGHLLRDDFGRVALRIMRDQAEDL